MPVYVYEHKETGERIELHQKVEEKKAPEGYVSVICTAGLINANSGRRVR